MPQPFGSNRPAAPFLLILIAGMSPGPGCYGPPPRQDIEGEDTTFFPAARVVFQHRAGEDGEPVRPVLGGELEFAYAGGETDIAVGPGAPIQLDRQAIPAPANVQLDYRLFDSSAAMRGGLWIHEIVGIEGILGLGFRDLYLRARTASIDDEESIISAGPLVGGQITLCPLGQRPWGRPFSLYGRGNVSGQWAEEGKDEDSWTAEVGVEVGPFHNLGAFAGWRWWSVERERTYDDSKLELDLNGPIFGVILTF